VQAAEAISRTAMIDKYSKVFMVISEASKCGSRGQSLIFYLHPLMAADKR
jgi:hypothetical protein